MRVESNSAGAVAASAPRPATNESSTVRRETAQQIYQQSILSASITVSLSSGNEALSLLYRSAIESLNQVLAPELGDQPITTAFQSGLDVSPEATAGRIVSLSTGFFSLYRESNPQKDEATALKDFAELIGGAIDQGFAEARKILDGMGVLQGDIAGNIDRTYELVQSGLKAFVDGFSTAEAEAATATATDKAASELSPRSAPAR
jgi:hypothetical protein